MSEPATLPPAAAAKLEELARPDVLGASRQLGLAADALLALANDWTGDGAGLLRCVRATVDDLMATRGAASKAVANALALMVTDIDKQDPTSLPSVRSWLSRGVGAYDAAARGWLDALTSHATELLEGRDRVLAYDYSSSVAAVIRAWAQGRRAPAVVVPESRVLAGGRPYLTDLHDVSLSVDYVPDAAMVSAMESCDAVLVGAETVSREGGAYNTLGTFLTALAARHHGVPFYVATTLIKTDLDTPPGRRREIPSLDVGPRLLGEWRAEEPLRVTARCPELDYTPPELVSALLTEEGALDPASVEQRARALFRSFNGTAHA